MLMKFDNRVVCSDLIVVGHSGVITSTGGSVNIEVGIEEVLKGQLDHKRIRIALSIIGLASPPEFETGKRYIWFLKVRQVEDIPVYSLVDDDPNAVIPWSDRILQEIQALVAGAGSAP